MLPLHENYPGAGVTRPGENRQLARPLYPQDMDRRAIRRVLMLLGE